MAGQSVPSLGCSLVVLLELLLATIRKERLARLSLALHAVRHAIFATARPLHKDAELIESARLDTVGARYPDGLALALGVTALPRVQEMEALCHRRSVVRSSLLLPKCLVHFLFRQLQGLSVLSGFGWFKMCRALRVGWCGQHKPEGVLQNGRDAPMQARKKGAPSRSRSRDAHDRRGLGFRGLLMRNETWSRLHTANIMLNQSEGTKSRAPEVLRGLRITKRKHPAGSITKGVRQLKPHLGQA